MKRTGFALAVALASIFPCAANGQAFDFNAWFEGLSTKELPEVGIRLDPERRPGAYCETDFMVQQWPSCFQLVFFRAYIKNDQLNTSGQPLTIGLSWTTATGQSGYEILGGSSPIIGVNESESKRFEVSIPDDNIVHSCNKLIVHVRSLTPGLYKTMPYTPGQGFEYVTYIDNDGGNPDAPDGDDERVQYYKNKFTKYCTR